jgi:hypothetical protein
MGHDAWLGIMIRSLSLAHTKKPGNRLNWRKRQYCAITDENWRNYLSNCLKSS